MPALPSLYQAATLWNCRRKLRRLIRKAAYRISNFPAGSANIMHTPWIYLSSWRWCITDLDLRWNLYSSPWEGNAFPPRHCTGFLVSFSKRHRSLNEPREGVHCYLLKFHRSVDEKLRATPVACHQSFFAKLYFKSFKVPFTRIRKEQTKVSEINRRQTSCCRQNAIRVPSRIGETFHLQKGINAKFKVF